MTDQNGAQAKRRSLGSLPQQPALTSERIKLLLSKALLDPGSLSHDDIRQITASVVFHLQELKDLAFRYT